MDKLINFFYWSIVAAIVLLTPWHNPPEPSTTDSSFEHARQIEMAWINQTFDQELDYLLAPMSPLPCPANIQDIPDDIRRQTQEALDFAQTGLLTRSFGILNDMVGDDSAHWLPVLTLVVLYVQDDQEGVALQIVENYLRADEKQEFIKQLKQDQGQSDETRIGLIHLLYINALLRLKAGQYTFDRLLWGGLKYPIGISKSTGLGLNLTTNVPIKTPGCPDDENDLTTYKLYNNLIVGYLKSQNYKAAESRWQKECQRDSLPPRLNPLFPILEELCSRRQKFETYWEWTISNTESLLTMAPTPPDSLLSFNLMLLIDSLLKQHGAQLANQKKALSQKQEEMLHLSLSEWESAPKEYKQILGPSLGKLATTLAVNQGDQIPPKLEYYQTDKQAAEVIKAIRLTVSIRNGDPIQELTSRRGEIKQTLGMRADEWLKAMDNYLPAYDRLFSWIFYNIKNLLILFSAFVVWLLGKWMVIQVREIKALFRSFYREDWERINK